MLLVIGDSHSVIWGGRLVLREPDRESQFPQVKVHHLGAALAYNLMGENGKPGKWGAEILSLVAGYGSEVSAIMLCFGEIDVRTQVIKRAVGSNLSIHDTAAIIAGRYMEFVDILREQVSVPIFLWGVTASAKDFGFWDPSFPNCGSERERNVATKSFNDLLDGQSCKRHGVHYVGILERLTTHAMLTRPNLLDDGVHVGLEALEYAIEAFGRVVVENNLKLPDFFDLSGSLRDKKHSIKSISKSAKIIKTSSNFQGTVPSGISVNDAKSGFIFHTDQDNVPFVLIDIGHGALVHKISIYNRFDGHGDRAESLEVYVGNETNSLRLAYSHPGGTFGELSISFDGSPSFRHILCKLRRKEFFHLGGIEILAYSFL